MITLTEVELRNASEMIAISLEHAREILPYADGTVAEGDLYWVTAVGITNGKHVGGLVKWSFRDLASARAKANGYFQHLTEKGWARTK